MKLQITGLVGFGPTITDLEGRCLIQTRPQAHARKILTGINIFELNAYLIVPENTISVRLNFEKSIYLKQILAILPNIDEKTGRTRINKQENEESFQIYIEARDTVAIRAALGSITKWILIADRLVKEVQ